MKGKVIAYFYLFLLCVVSCQKETIKTVGTQELSPNEIKELKNLGIPNDYISDADFISMATQSPKATKTIYAAPNGKGDGSESSPYSLEDALDALKAGTHLYLKGGKYDVKEGVGVFANGEASAYIVISSAPNEEAILTSSTNGSGEIHLLEIGGSYIIVENITFKDAQCKNVAGIVFYEGGQHHIIIRNNVFDSIKTPKIGTDYNANAILLFGESSKGIKQVMIFENIVSNNVLGYSEAISIAGNCENIYVLLNIVKDNTNIGIDFYGNAGYCKTQSLDQPRKSVGMYNYVTGSVSPYASCAGIYADGSKEILISDNTIVKSQYGIEIGSEERNDQYPVTDILVQRNLIQDNIEVGIRIGGFDQQDTGEVKNTVIKSNVIKGTKDGEEVIVSKVNGITFEHNEFTSTGNYIDIEFSDKYAKNLEFTNNVFYGDGSFVMYGREELSLDEFIKQFPTNTKG
ncbi:MAG: right-handed parallel beta-helix repeat-containing protein [archaeon]|nr:right-handed parallel beta-helix repeat-containing protein [archaeon]